MKAISLGVFFAGYVLVVYGFNHITKGCVGFKNTVWPSGGQIADPCAGLASAPSTAAPAGSGAALSGLASSAQTAGSGAYAVGTAGTTGRGGVYRSSLPGAGTNGGPGITAQP